MSEDVRRRAAKDWARIGELVSGARDRFEARAILTEECGFVGEEVDVVLSMTVGDLAEFVAVAAAVPTADGARRDWETRGTQYTPGVFRLEERGAWAQWIRDGVDNQWLTAARLASPGSVWALSRTNDDRSIFIDHDQTDGSLIRVHTSIGDTYTVDDMSLASQVCAVIDASDSDMVDNALRQGVFGVATAVFEGESLHGRSFQWDGWWGVLVDLAPRTQTVCVGRSATIPALELLRIWSFDEIHRHQPS